MTVVDDAMRTLEQYGLSDIIIPFLLVFTVVYAILLKIEIFGKSDAANRYYLIIALALGLGVIIPHSTNLYAIESDPVIIINTSLPAVAGIIVALIMVLVLIGAFGWKFMGGEWFRNIFALSAFTTVLYIFGSSAGWFPYSFTLDYYFPPEVQSLVIILLVFGIIVWLITGGAPKGDAWAKIKDALGEFKVEGKK